MKRINIIFDDREADLLSVLQKEYGGTIPQVVRSAVKVYFDKTFPPHTRTSARTGTIISFKEEGPELTPEQACESVGGKIETVNGIPMCSIQISKSMMRKIPLSDTASILKLKNP